MNLFVVAAIDSELTALRRELNSGKPNISATGCSYSVHTTPQHKITINSIGVGMVNAAINLVRLLKETACDQIVLIGSAGAFPDSSLEIGDLTVATSEVLSELGVCYAHHCGTADSLNLPGLDREILLDNRLAHDLFKAAARVGRANTGRMLTVAGVSGDTTVAEIREKTFGALAENMEGYGVARAGLNARDPCGRGPGNK